MTVDSVRIRINQKDKEELDELARMLGVPRSEILRRVIEEGLRNTRMRIATEKVLEREFSLSRAAEFSGISIHRMAEYLASRRTPYFRQSIRDAEEDARTAKNWIQET